MKHDHTLKIECDDYCGIHIPCSFSKRSYNSEFLEITKRRLEICFPLQKDEDLLVSWCFKPSQPQRITSGLTLAKDVSGVGRRSLPGVWLKPKKSTFGVILGLV